jgi:hypothetical protein
LNKVGFYIITVHLNDSNSFSKTAQSILKWAENEVNWHWFIKDGLSDSNHTNSINATIELFPAGRVTLIAEPDEGIYHAMNQIIPSLKEDDFFCLFLNCGDEISNELCNNWQSIRLRSLNIDLFYGDYWYRQEESITRKSSPSQINWAYLIAKTINHQSMWIKSSLIKKYPFKTHYKIVADWVQLFLMMRNEKINYQYFPLPFVIYQGGGYSELNDDKRLNERREFLASLYSTWELNDINILSRLSIRPWFSFTKRSLDSPLRSWLLKMFNKIDSFIRP